MPKDNSHFFRSTLIIACCAFLSRVLGLLRVSLLASFYGATEAEGLSDCYSAAFKLPDIIFNLVAFGAISIVLIPYFSGFVKKDKLEDLKKNCSSFLNFFFFVISFFIVLGIIFTPSFVRNFLVKGWTNESNIILTIKMARILLLQVLFMTLSGIFGSYLNAIEKFIAYALALLSYNIGIIAGILLLAPIIGIEGVAWGAVLGSFIHLTIQASGSFKNGFKYYFKLPTFNKEIRELILIAIPRMIAISGEQFVKFFIVNIASFLFVGSIFIFENAENFSMVPFGMIAVSISTTSFPIFSKLYVSKKYNDLLETLLEKLRHVMFFILPICLLMIILRTEIIELLLGYNKYSNNDVILTSNALAFYLIGIPFFSLTIVIAKYYYAQKKSFIPMIISLFSAAIAIFNCYFFSKSYDITGLSIGRSIGYIVQALLLIFFLYIINRREKLYTIFPYKILYEIFLIIFISILILIPGLIFKDHFSFSQNIKLDAIFKIAFVGSFIAILYLFLCNLFKIPEVKSLLKKNK